MKKKVMEAATRVINRNLSKEANAVCGFIGYQPNMPDSVKKFKDGKKK